MNAYIDDEIVIEFNKLSLENQEHMCKVIDLMVTSPEFNRELQALPLSPGHQAPAPEDVNALVVKYWKGARA